MSFRRSFFSVPLCLCAALLFAAGCWRAENGAYVAEVDEPEYRRAKELLKQGRTPEALVEFDKVLSKRGLNNAPETHMDMAILYQQHVRDQLAAIYHYQKYLALMPNAPRRDAVQQRIDAAKREYVSTLPGRPSLDLGGASTEYVETISRLRAQNEQLRAALIAAQTLPGLTPPGGSAQRGAALQDPRAVTVENPIVVAAPGAQPQPVQQPQSYAVAPVQTQPQQQQQPQPRAQPQQQQQPAQQPAARRHTVRQKDTLYSISRHYYGTAKNAQIEGIVNANRDVLESRNTPLREGMVLRIP